MNKYERARKADEFMRKCQTAGLEPDEMEGIRQVAEDYVTGVSKTYSTVLPNGETFRYEAAVQHLYFSKGHPAASFKTTSRVEKGATPVAPDRSLEG